MIRDTGWFKSSLSSAGSDACVEVRFVGGGQVGVRDSKSPAGGVLVVGPGAWNGFLAMTNRDWVTTT